MMQSSAQDSGSLAAPGRRAPAPGRLELVRSFVNTLDVETGDEDLSSTEALSAWLAGHGLLPRGTRLDEHDLADVRAFREALRAVLEGHSGEAVAPAAIARLDRITASVPLRLRLGVDPHLEPAADGLGAAIGGLLAAIAESITAGTWSRLKVCRSDTCRWAYYDSSRNRSGAWCSMAICGNRMKGRSFRRRHAPGARTAG